MKIPSRLKLMGMTITVDVHENHFRFEESKNDCCSGWANYRANQILIRPTGNEELLEHAFWHELMHFVMYYAGGTLPKECEWPHREENFIDLTAAILMQAINSFEYDKGETQ